MHPITFGGQSLPDRLNSLVLSYRDHPMTVQLHCTDVPEGLDERVEFELFRIAQEAQQNAGKHADAHNAYINLTGDDTGADSMWTPSGNPHWDSATSSTGPAAYMASWTSKAHPGKAP